MSYFISSNVVIAGFSVTEGGWEEHCFSQAHSPPDMKNQDKEAREGLCRPFLLLATNLLVLLVVEATLYYMEFSIQ